MESRIYRQFHGFLITPALFINSDFLEFSLFKTDLKPLKIDFKARKTVGFYARIAYFNYFLTF